MNNLSLPTTPVILQKDCVTLTLAGAAFAVTAGIGATMVITIGAVINTVQIGDKITVNGIEFTFAAANNYPNNEIGISPTMAVLLNNIGQAIIFYYPTLVGNLDVPLRKLTLSFPCGSGLLAASFTELPPITSPAPMTIVVTQELASIEYNSIVTLNIYTGEFALKI